MNDPLYARLDRTFHVGDTRLSYGITVPLLVGLAVIVGFMTTADWWLMLVALFVVIGLTAVVTFGVSRMLAESGDDDEPLT
jgi:hypothetical protein